MADNTKIEWTDATWNPNRGCTRVSQGCVNCYAEVMAARFSDPGQWGHGLAQRVTLPDGRTDHRWTGKVAMIEDQLDQPLRWTRPRRIFVNSTSDTFHESVPDAWLDRMFAVMSLRPQHTFQVLTKRPERMRDYLNYSARWAAVLPTKTLAGGTKAAQRDHWPLRNVWIGTSIEDQATADERIAALLATPAAVRFLSVEPLLAPVDLSEWLICLNARDGLLMDPTTGAYECCSRCDWTGALGGIDWVIVGGESGPGARPMHPDWARSLRDQCIAAGVSFFFKQWGEWAPSDDLGDKVDGAAFGCFNDAGQWVFPCTQAFANAGRQTMFRIGKKAAGRLLDGREWNEMPGVAHG